MWKPKFLRVRGQEILETWDIPLLVAQFPPHLLFVIPSHSAHSMVGSCSEPSFGINNQTPEPSPRGHSQPTGAGPTCSTGVLTNRPC